MLARAFANAQGRGAYGLIGVKIGLYQFKLVITAYYTLCEILTDVNMQV